ncbi:MAG: efflux RND transporter periplasmic adaptor subunit [Candidatus Melainabacteria bacterium]|nr:efflux RND transporter periplasmic adaptor subunit [Candidatus Melainabacteria bacterium]
MKHEWTDPQTDPPSQAVPVASPSRSQKTSGWRMVLGVLLLLGLLLALVLGKLMLKFGGGPPGGFAGMGAVQVAVAPVKRQDVPVVYRAVGSLEAGNTIRLKAEALGVVRDILFQEGERVPQGKVLFRLEPDFQNAELDQAQRQIQVSEAQVQVSETTIAQLQAALQAAKARAALARDEFERYQTLFQQEFVSALELSQKRTAYETAQAEQTAAEQQVQQAKAQRVQAESERRVRQAGHDVTRARLRDTVVRAPVPGVMGQRQVDIGQYVLQTDVLATLVDTRQLKVVFSLPEKYLGQVQPGDFLTLQVASLPGKSFPARVSFISPSVAVETRLLTVKANISEPTARAVLKPGQFAQVKLRLGLHPQALVVPEEAVVQRGKRHFVYTVEASDPNAAKTTAMSSPAKPMPGASPWAFLMGLFGANTPKTPPSSAALPQSVAVERPVTIGESLPGQVEIIEGLAPTARIIVAGLQKIQSGMPVVVTDKTVAPGTSAAAAAEPAKE